MRISIPLPRRAPSLSIAAIVVSGLLPAGCSGEPGARVEVRSPTQASVGPPVVARPPGGCPPSMREVDGQCTVCETRHDCDERCTAGDGKSCSLAALFYESGVSGEGNRRKAQGLYERGCALGSVDSCEGLAACLSTGKACALDRERSRAIRRELCVQGHAGGCLAVAAAQLEEKGDRDETVRLAERACLLGDADGCAFVVRHCQELTPLRAPSCAKEAARRACRLARAEHCDGTAIATEGTR